LVSGCNEIEVNGPAFAESISEGDIRWRKKVGDAVRQDEVVAEIETDKVRWKCVICVLNNHFFLQTTVEVPAPAAGVITALLVNDGDKVGAKQLLYKMNVGASGGAAPSAPAAPAKAAATPPSPPPAAKPAAAATSIAGPAPARPPPSALPPTQPMKSVAAADVRPIVASTGAQQPVRVPGGTVSVPHGVPVERAITGDRAETRVGVDISWFSIAFR
jgi:2-oxoglutarate dehydrogenase E2 component (dihydrolipoamide succinyltransferase)